MKCSVAVASVFVAKIFPTYHAMVFALREYAKPFADHLSQLFIEGYGGRNLEWKVRRLWHTRSCLIFSWQELPSSPTVELSVDLNKSDFELFQVRTVQCCFVAQY